MKGKLLGPSPTVSKGYVILIGDPAEERVLISSSVWVGATEPLELELAGLVIADQDDEKGGLFPKRRVTGKQPQPAKRSVKFADAVAATEREAERLCKQPRIEKRELESLLLNADLRGCAFGAYIHGGVCGVTSETGSDPGW